MATKRVTVERKPRVTLGVDAGGRDADEATRAHYMALRGLLAAECVGPYGTAFCEFALVLRIDGSVQTWGRRGVGDVRLQRKSRYATADIFVPAELWQSSPTTIRAFLASEMKSAISKIVDRASSKKDSIDGGRLNADVERAIEKFLALA
jgi:hypothetical protein